MSRLASLTVLVLFVAGCLGGGPGAQDAPVDPGTAGPMPDDADPVPPPTDEGSHLAWQPSPRSPRTVLWLNATLDTDAMSWFGGTVDPDGSLHVEVPDGARGLVVEVAWRDSLQDLDLNVVSPGWCPVGDEWPTGFADYAACSVPDIAAPSGSSTGYWRDDGGVPGASDAPVLIAIGAEDLRSWGCGRGERGCMWALWLYSDVAIVDLDITWAVTVFLDEEPPADYRLL